MKKSAIAVMAAALTTVALAACGSSSGGKGSISLVAYSTPKEAYADLIPGFQKTPAGKGVQFTQSYGASGDQSRAVDGGLHADVVAFSLEPDVKIVTPNPFTSGGARWNIMAAYGSQIAQGKTPAQAQAFLAALLKNV